MSTTFGLSVTRNDIINAALRTLGKLGKTQTASSTDLTNCSQALNLMLKAWMAKSITLWKIEEVVVPLVSGFVTYAIGNTAGTLATAGVTITDGGTGGTDGTYALGITDSTGSGATGTYTISGGTVTAVAITAAGTTYTAPTLAFPSGGVSGVTVDVTVVGVTGDRPLRVLDQASYVRNNTTGDDTTVSLISRQEFNELSAKAGAVGTPGATSAAVGTPASGVPTQIWYDPQLTNGLLYVYPTLASDLDYSLHLVCQMPIADTTNPSSLFDFPQEFMNAIKWGLCREIYTEYGVDEQTERRVERMYQQYVVEAFDFSQEEAPVYFTYDMRGRGF